MIPLIILTYNQPTYTLNLVNWWQFYYPDYPIFILDNNSDNPQQVKYYHLAESLHHNLRVCRFATNDCAGNLKDFLKSLQYDYYCISDCDIMPHPDTPFNFLEILKHCIDAYGFHRAGFQLDLDLPEWTNKRAHLIHDEMELRKDENHIEYEGKIYKGHKAPIDTTFALYTKKNSGWHAPMDGTDWSNCIRLFRAFHLAWYLDKDHVPKEMKHYYSTCVKHDGGISAGKNNYRV